VSTGGLTFVYQPVARENQYQLFQGGSADDLLKFFIPAVCVQLAFCFFFYLFDFSPG
jgi:hypothetical protein